MQKCGVLVFFLLALLTVASATPVKRATKPVLWGISYAPALYANATCATKAQVKADIKLIKDAGITQIRMYGQECNQLEYVLEAVKDTNIKVLAGVWFGDLERYKSDWSIFFKTIKKYKSYLGKNLQGVVIGNEAIYGGWAKESTVIYRLRDVRQKLKDANLSVKITTSEPPHLYSKKLIAEVDFLLPNIHPYFADQTAKTAYDYVLNTVKGFQKQTSKMIIVGETGWPTAGQSNGRAVPSLSNQKTFATAIACKASANNLKYYFFEAFDILWKPAGDWGVEPHWGVWDSKRKAKLSLSSLKC